MESVLARRLRQRLGYPVHLLQVGLFPHRQNKILLFGFQAGRSEPSVVCRLSRTPEGSALMRQEARARAMAYGRLADVDRSAVPWLMVEELPTGTCLIEPFVTGRPMAVPDRARLLERLGKQTLGWARALRQATSEPAAPEGAVRQEAEATLRRVTTGFEGRAIRELAERVRPGLAALSGLTPAAVHGDFWHGNLKLAGGKLRVLDWEYAQERGNPLFDPILHLVAMSVAQPGAIAERFEEAFLRPSERSRLMGRLLEAHAAEAGSRQAMAMTLVLVTMELVLRNLETSPEIRADRHYPLLERLAAEADPLAAIPRALWPNRP